MQYYSLKKFSREKAVTELSNIAMHPKPVRQLGVDYSLESRDIFMVTGEAENPVDAQPDYFICDGVVYAPIALDFFGNTPEELAVKPLKWRWYINTEQRPIAARTKGSRVWDQIARVERNWIISASDFSTQEEATEDFNQIGATIPLISE